MDGTVIWDSANSCYRLIPSGADEGTVDIAGLQKMRWIAGDGEAGGHYEPEESS